MDTVTIKMDSKWARIVRSPVYFIVAALQGVSVSFAPYFLYLSGKGQFYHGHEGIIVPLCFAVICFVPAFYFVLCRDVIRELKQKSAA